MSKSFVGSNLPIAAVCDDVCRALMQGNAILQAEPGAGKSTGLPLALLRAGLGGKILPLEPRRLAAINVASRLASQLGEPLGRTIGLRMRGRTEVSTETRLEVVTEGVLTRILQSDPLLEGVALVIFDEFHERSLHADLGLALCLDVQHGLREDLRLLLMSATLDGDALSQHLQVAAPIVCTVRQHPVDIIWCGESRDPLPQTVARIAQKALVEQSGDVLVFLPGVAEIERTARLMGGRLPEGVELHRLHGGASAAAQRVATAPAGVARRLILSTSIAETSITIDGVRVVVDAGVERRSKLDASGAERLETVMASQASATQRAGRAGRTAPGVCYRLWAKSGHGHRAKRWQPEVLRAELSPLLLELGQWGVSEVNALPWVDTPPEASIARAKSLLQRLQLWRGNGLSEQGRIAAKLPLHPRLAHMLLWANAQGAAADACTLAALLEEKLHQREADLAPLLEQVSKPIAQRAAQLRRLLPASGPARTFDRLSAAVLLAQAYPDRIAQRRSGREARYLLSGGAGAVLNDQDALAQSEWLVVVELGGAGSEARIFAALAIAETELEIGCAEIIESVERVDWDDRQERVIAQRQRCIGAVVLESKLLHVIDPEQRASALMAGLRRKGLQSLNWTEDAQEWQARVERMRELAGEGAGFPEVSDARLLETLEQWLQPFVGNKSTLKALAQIDLMDILPSLLDYAQQQKLDSWFPRRYNVPSGSEHKLRYACEGSPVLAVKLQEMFGCRENPAVAGGRLLLKVELLSPARRPVQITEDLANFWHNSYPAVKKDLAGRYPKHPWPDDPLNAEATARAKPRKR